uniref:Uncharacterized protein n=1 Tax=Anguilla anguilla TaxID=7936 RepID=A0A0E9SUM5_ANGAN
MKTFHFIKLHMDLVVKSPKLFSNK